MYEVNIPCEMELELDNIERDILSRAINLTGNNKADAAKLLGIRRTCLIYKLKRLGLFTTREEHNFAATRRELHRYRQAKKEASKRDE